MRAYTQGSAYAEGAENEKGLLKPGMLADIVVFSDDLFALEPVRLLEVEVLLTMVDGRIVHER